MGAKKLLLSTLSIRKRLMATGSSYKNPNALKAAMVPFSKWISFYGKNRLTDEGCAAMLRLHRDKFLFLLPGKDSGIHENYLNQFKQIISE